MDIITACGSHNPGASAYALGFMIGLTLDIWFWVYGRRVARRPASQRILTGMR